MRLKVYLAGPISKGDLATNVNQATAAFVALAKAGFAPFCPHWSCYSKPAEYSDSPWGGKTDRLWCEATAMGNEEMQHADWMGVDLPWVAVSDAVLRLPGISTGADLETACARDHGVPVFTSIAELRQHFAVVAHFAAAKGAPVTTKPQCTGCRDSGWNVCGDPCPCSRLAAHAADGDALAADVLWLREWANAGCDGLRFIAAGIIRVLDHLESQGNLVLALAEHCKRQASLLRAQAEAVRAGADGTRGAA